MIKGNLVNWTSAQFELQNMTYTELPVAQVHAKEILYFLNVLVFHFLIMQVCKVPNPGDIIYPAPRTFDNHNAICIW